MKKEYSLKMIDKSKEIAIEKLDLTPIAIPFGDEIPKTHHESIARILFASGQIGIEQYLKMSGVQYDYDDYEVDDDYDDDFDDLDFTDLETEYTKEPTTELFRSSPTGDEPSTSLTNEVVPDSKATLETPSTTEAS